MPDVLDVAIVGAGFGGLHAIHHLREKGYNVHAYDAAGDVGGTWYWNRYPGAVVDIESIEYSFSFSDEIQQEWNWKRRYSTRDELMEYINWVADKLDLRRSITFNTRISSAVFDEAANLWSLTTDKGDVIKAHYCIMATGFLSAPNEPRFEGLADFKGETYHSAKWPKNKVDFSGKRVGIIGVGSSGIQIIPIVAEEAKHLTVFQRTPVFAVPLRNGPIDEEFAKEVKANYPEWRRREREESFGGWISVNKKPVELVTELCLESTPEQRRALYEDRYKNGGLAIYNNYPDLYTNREANDTLVEFLHEKIRERIKDPELAEKLLPRGFPVLAKRLCCDTNYYEAYNRDNVSLVDVKANPIERFTEKGVVVAGVEHELDAVIFATGFDALTGALSRMDICGLGGETLKEHWAEGAKTTLGLMIHNFPNMFILGGPGSPVPLFQPVLLGEDQTRWIGDCLAYMDKHGYARIDATQAAEEKWVKACTDAVNATLFPLAQSWYMGANVPGKTRIGLCYFGGITNYWAACNSAARNGYEGFDLSK